MFYPTGYIVGGCADSASSEEAQASLQLRGFGNEDRKYVSAAEMAHEAARNLEHPSFFASTGSSMPTRQKQLELARDGHDFEIGRATSELQSLMRISYAVFCLKKKKTAQKTIQLDISKHTNDTQDKIKESYENENIQ